MSREELINEIELLELQLKKKQLEQDLKDMDENKKLFKGWNNVTVNINEYKFNNKKQD